MELLIRQYKHVILSEVAASFFNKYTTSSLDDLRFLPSSRRFESEV